jgi:hypothetical protein
LRDLFHDTECLSGSWKKLLHRTIGSFRIMEWGFPDAEIAPPLHCSKRSLILRKDRPPGTG